LGNFAMSLRSVETGLRATARGKQCIAFTLTASIMKCGGSRPTSAWTREPIAKLSSDPDLFATYNIHLEKIRIEAAGYCKAGPIRPPYNFMPEPYAECARENARRWRQLCEKYAKAFAR
jgi:hypothetical protein